MKPEIFYFKYLIGVKFKKEIRPKKKLKKYAMQMQKFHYLFSTCSNQAVSSCK